MDTGLSNDLRQRTEQLRSEGLFKEERTITSPQGAHIELADGRRVINFCANNYLGLANDQRLELAAAAGMAEHGYGTASVRFICGTQSVHKELESRLAEFLDMDDTILSAYSKPQTVGAEVNRVAAGHGGWHRVDESPGSGVPELDQTIVSARRRQ